MAHGSSLFSFFRRKRRLWFVTGTNAYWEAKIRRGTADSVAGRVRSLAEHRKAMGE